MRTIPASFVVSIFAALAGCAEQPSLQSSAIASASDDPNVFPRIDPTGRISASDLVTVFQETCLARYPDKVATLSVFQAKGFKVNAMRVDDDYGDPYGNFSDPSRGISAEVVTIEITDAGPGGTSLYSPVCGLLADVKDPDADWAALMQGLHVEGQSIAWSREDPTTGIYLRDGKELNIYLSEPQLKGKVYLPEGACGDLPDCVGWGSAYIAVRESR